MSRPRPRRDAGPHGIQRKIPATPFFMEYMLQPLGHLLQNTMFILQQSKGWITHRRPHVLTFLSEMAKDYEVATYKEFQRMWHSTNHLCKILARINF